MQQFDLKRFRTDNDLTQVDVAELFTCKQNFISNIEKGLKPMPPDKLDILASKYGDISSYITQNTPSSHIISAESKSGMAVAGTDVKVNPDLSEIVKMIETRDNLVKDIMKSRDELMKAQMEMMKTKDEQISKLMDGILELMNGNKKNE